MNLFYFGFSIHTKFGTITCLNKLFKDIEYWTTQFTNFQKGIKVKASKQFPGFK